MNEVLQISDDWTIELSKPTCELRLQCKGDMADRAVRVHECSFKYACRKCAAIFVLNVGKSYERYDKMGCKFCQKKFDRNSYFEILKLDEM